MMMNIEFVFLHDSFHTSLIIQSFFDFFSCALWLFNLEHTLFMYEIINAVVCSD